LISEPVYYDLAVRKSPPSKDLIREAIARSDNPGLARNSVGVSKVTSRELMQRCKIDSPESWEHHFAVGTKDGRRIPDVIISNEWDRTFVGTLVGTEGAITCRYEKTQRKTALLVIVEMTDRDYIARFAEIVGLSQPMSIGRFTLPGHRAKFRRTLMGLRALRVLREVTPMMYGDKKREARIAIESFAPTGYREGLVVPADVWGELCVSPRVDTERYIRNPVLSGLS